jgi:ABC-type glycerol-3-phosphate transport system substrate-binding protein
VRFLRVSVLLVAFALGATGCGGGGSGRDPGIPTGTDTLTVTGSSGDAKQTIGLLLIVQ